MLTVCFSCFCVFTSGICHDKEVPSNTNNDLCASHNYFVSCAFMSKCESPFDTARYYAYDTSIRITLRQCSQNKRKHVGMRGIDSCLIYGSIPLGHFPKMLLYS